MVKLETFTSGIPEINATRRGFLIGSSVAVGALALSPQLKAFQKLEGGTVVRGVIKPRYRKIYDVLVSCDPIPRDAAINHIIRRNHNQLFAMRINARASFRWVAVPNQEIIFTKNDVMFYEVDPCTNGMQMCFHCNDENGEAYAEYFQWVDDKLVQEKRTSLRYSETAFEEWSKSQIKAA